MNSTIKNRAELAQALQHHRKARGLGQKDMRLLIGMSQQQYQRAESGGDIRLSALFRILEGLGLELQLEPRGQLTEEENGLAETDIREQPSAWSDILDGLED